MSPDLDIEPVVLDVMKLVGLVRRVPHDLFRYAAHIYTGTAQRPFLHDGCFRPVFRRALRVRQPAATSAYYDQVILFRHCFLAPLLLFALRVLPDACDNMRRLERISVRQ